MTTTSAADRIAALRDEYKRLGEDVDHLSDLDLLNEYAEHAERQRIDTTDRYMRLLTEQRKHGEQVRAGFASELRGRLDILAEGAVQRMVNDLTRILGAVDALPERANAEQVARLKQIASDTRHMLRLMGDRHPTQVWKLDNNRDLVHSARGVIGVLRDKGDVPASEVIRLVGEALTPNGNLRDLFDVAGPAPARRQPVFAGSGWTEMGGGNYWTFEPASSRFRVVAYALGDTWYLDLQGPTGALIAAGETAEAEVAETAAVLVEQAPVLAKSGLRPWQCWQQVVESLAPVATAEAA